MNTASDAQGATAIARQKVDKDGRSEKSPRQTVRDAKSKMGTTRIPVRFKTTVKTLAKYFEASTAPSHPQIIQFSSSGHEIRREVQKAKNTEFKLLMPKEARAQAVKSNAMP